MLQSASEAAMAKSMRGVDQLVEDVRGGDLQAAEELLIQYLPLIRQKVLYYGRLADYQDLLQQGRLIFLEIVKEYDSRRGVPFGAYLKEKFAWRLFHYIRDELGYRNKEDLFSDVPANTVQHILATHAVLEPDEADWEALEEAVKRLTPKQRLVLSLFYWDELPVRDIAKTLHETPQGVRQLKARAEKHLRRSLLGRSPLPQAKTLSKS
jgi:RNA polymerase sigma factor (sigma-70 family)